MKRTYINNIVDRGGIETRQEFVKRNIKWWRRHKAKEMQRDSRKGFLKTADPKFRYDLTVGEIGAGAVGGMIELNDLPCKHKYFIDYIMREQVEAELIFWPDNATYITAPCEAIPLPDDTIDILLSFNALDHGWDVYKCIDECVRISKTAHIAFDCRGDDPEQGNRKERFLLEHKPFSKFRDIKQYLSKFDCIKRVMSLESVDFPMIYFEVKK